MKILLELKKYIFNIYACKHVCIHVYMCVYLNICVYICLYMCISVSANFGYLFRTKPERVLK